MNKRNVLVVFALLLGLLPLLLITSLTAVAQGGILKITPTPSKFATPSPTSKGGAGPRSPSVAPPVAFDNSASFARGTHGGGRSTYTFIVVNSGAASSAGTIARASIPWNAAYVPGSAAIQGGGGALAAHVANVEWQGTVGAGKSVTFTFQVTLPLGVGTLVTDTLVIYDPQAETTVNYATALHVQSATGGPDAYGYTYKDSFAAGGPAFAYIPPSITATHEFTPSADDIFTGPIPLQFNFRFYGNVYTQAFVSTNGLVSFGAGNSSYPQTTIPNLNPPNNFIGCFYSDMIVRNAAQGVWYQTFGSAPNRMTVITFSMPDFHSGVDGPIEPFQTILYESDNHITCQYADNSKAIAGSGSTAVIGLESPDGAAGLQYHASLDSSAHIVGPVEGGHALELASGPASLPVFATSQKSASFTVHPNEIATFTVAMRNTGVGDAPATTLSDPVPGNATYLPGSAKATSGIVTGTGSLITWTGMVTHGNAVSVTYRVMLPANAGALVSSTATINAPNAAIAQHVSAGIHVLPPMSGGPDPYGYTYEDSHQSGGPVFNWIAPTFTATQLFALNDDDVFTGPLPLGFTLHFYGQIFNSAFVSSNGMVTFLAGTEAPHSAPIPTRDDPNDFATCQWSDQIVSDPTDGALIQTFGDAPNRQTVITFRLGYFQVTGPAHEYQMVLFEGSDRVLCQYLDNGGNPLGTGDNAAIGLENADGGAGIQYFVDSDFANQSVGPLENGLAVLFTPGGAHTIFVNSDMVVSEGEHPGEVITYGMHVRNTGVTALLTHLIDPFPSGTAYVSNSAAVNGGGALNVSASRVDWQGALNPNASVTVTYRATLTALSGIVLNTATISEPLEVSTMVITAATPVQPYAGTSIGQESLYGYHDRYAPGGPTFSWVPTTPAAVSLFPITTDDGITGPLPIRFNFEFFGQTYSQVVVSSNGLVIFNTTGSTDFANLPILAPAGVSNYATCFWTDQFARIGNGVWIEATGAAPNRATVITFLLYDVGATGAAQPYLYQMILSENSNRIKCQYMHMSGFASGDGRGATIGLRNRLGNGGVQYWFGAYDQNGIGPIEDRLAILFDPGLRLWLPVVAR